MNYEERSLMMLEAGGFEQWFRLNMLRLIVSHRGIRLSSIAREMGIGTQYMDEIYSGYQFIRNPRTYNKLLDRMDDSISAIMRRRSDMCRCPDWFLLSLRDDLKLARGDV